MDAHAFEWLATGIATICLFIIKLLISAYRASEERQDVEIKSLSNKIGETQDRLGFVENVIAQLPNIDAAIKLHLLTKGD